MPTRVVVNWKTGEMMSREYTHSPDDFTLEEVLELFVELTLQYIFKTYHPNTPYHSSYRLPIKKATRQEAMKRD